MKGQTEVRPFQCHLVNHKSKVECCEIKQTPRDERPANNRLSQVTGKIIFRNG